MTQSTLQSSRRAFLKTGAAGVMTLGVGGMAQAATTAKALPKWDKEFDVIVVGSGLAGYCAGITAAELGRKTRPNIKLGICGEHGGDPSSIEFVNKLGLNYVSCSPFRVPIARLAAAQAAIKQK